MKTLIKNCFIIDGTGKKGYKSDILINNKIIEKISKQINETTENVIDAEENVVCPGFIDTHSHSDLRVFLNPDLEPKIRQGITTEILGQDGISVAPLPHEYISNWRKNLAGLDGDSEDIDWDFLDSKTYFQRLNNLPKSTNLAFLAPHGNIRMEAMGLENKIADKNDIKKMQDILRRELEAGAVGLSTGLIYIPCAYSDTNELIELNKVVAEYDGVFVVHQRSEADTILESMNEIIEVGRKTGVKIHFSHFKVCGKKNWNKIDKMVKLLEDVEKEDIKISFDQYPYAAGSTMLGVVLPPWVHEGGTNNLLERLKDKKVRQKIITQIEDGIPGWDNFIDFAGFEGIFITNVKSENNKILLGKNIKEIAEMQNKNPYDVIFDLLIEEENAVGMVDYYGLDEHLIKFMTLKYQNLCTDGILGGKPHPRVYGAFPKFIGEFVREKKIMSLEEAIYKTTKKAADVFGFNDRGHIIEGKKADIIIFDYEKINAVNSFDNPEIYPVGITLVMVNGKIVFNNGILNKGSFGELIYR